MIEVAHRKADNGRAYAFSEERREWEFYWITATYWTVVSIQGGYVSTMM